MYAVQHPVPGPRSHCRWPTLRLLNEALCFGDQKLGWAATDVAVSYRSERHDTRHI